MATTEFIVSGIPISTQASSRSKMRWKGDVAAAALATLSEDHALVADPVRVTIVYFYVSTELDLDNIIKPIVDALNEVIYVDDFQVVNITAAKRDLSGTLVLTDAPPAIIERLGVTADNPQDFVRGRGTSKHRNTLMMETKGQESVSSVADSYRRQGYEVVLEPEPSLLPKEARSLHPDFLAIKGDERVIVEVKYQQNLLAYPALTRLAEAIRRIPGWRLDVVVLEKQRRFTESQPLSLEDAKRRLASADHVARETGDLAAGLLLLWTAVEAVLRAQVKKQTEDIPTSTSRLPKLAYSLGLIDSEDVATAEWMTRIRNDVVHGRSESSVSQLDYDRARAFVIRLLQGTRESELLAS